MYCLRTISWRRKQVLLEIYKFFLLIKCQFYCQPEYIFFIFYRIETFSDSSVCTYSAVRQWFPCSIILPYYGFTLLQGGKESTQTCFLKQLSSFFFSFLHSIGNICLGGKGKVYENEALHIFYEIQKRTPPIYDVSIFIGLRSGQSLPLHCH